MARALKRENVIYQAQAVLSRRNHSEAEVRRKLSRKGFTQEQVEEAIAWLYQHKLLNDEEFVRSFIASTLAQKPVGPRWIIHRLRQREVSSDLIAEAIAATFTDEAVQGLVSQAAAQWRRAHPKQAHDEVRLQRFLLSRGFSFSDIQSITRQEE